MKHADFLNMLDQPGERKIHTIAIPRCGGLGLALGAIIATLCFIDFEEKLVSFLGASLLIIVFGLLDDRFELSYKWKFLGQLLAVIVAMFGGIYISIVPFLGLEPVFLFISLPLTVIFAIGVTNAVNLSDGLDGLAAGIMLLTFAAIAYLAVDANGFDTAVVALAVAGGIVGFLWFNTHPAIIFMGDAGSQFIGFMAVFLCIYLTQDVNPALNPALPLLLLGLPILDTLTVMVRRVRAGRSPFSPDKTHIHHRLMEYGFSHAEAVGSIYLLQGVFLASALRFRYASDIVVIGTYLIISATILLLFYWAGKTKWTLHHVIEGGDRRRNHLLRNDWVFQFCRYYINYAITTFLVIQLFYLADKIAQLSYKMYLGMALAIILFFISSKKNQDIWIRFSIYIAAIVANVMSNELPELSAYNQWVMNAFLLLLIIVVSVAIRITRKDKFRVTTQDVLVLLFIMAGFFLADIEWVEHVAFRLFCLVYALEYLLHQDYSKFGLTRYSSMLSGVVIVTIVLSTYL